MFSDWLQPKLKGAYHWMNYCCNGFLRVLRVAIQRFSRVRAPESAASIAYYALFSLFPLLLLLTGVLGYILVSVEAPGEVINFITAALPVERELIEENLYLILKARNTSGIIGLLVLMWSASSVFLTLIRSISRAWPGASVRNIIHGRLIAFLMIVFLIFLLVATVMLNASLNVLASLHIPIRGSITIYETAPWKVFTYLFPWFVAFLVFLGLYRWGPNTFVRWREAFWGALSATVGWAAMSSLFTWYLSSGLSQYEVIYGSLTAILVLLTWVYLGANITLFGAHLSAAIAHETRLHPLIEEEE